MAAIEMKVQLFSIKKKSSQFKNLKTILHKLNTWNRWLLVAYAGNILLMAGVFRLIAI